MNPSWLRIGWTPMAWMIVGLNGDLYGQEKSEAIQTQTRLSATGPEWALQATSGKSYRPLIAHYYRKTLKADAPAAKIIIPSAHGGPLTERALKAQVNAALLKK